MKSEPWSWVRFLLVGTVVLGAGCRRDDSAVAEIEQALNLGAAHYDLTISTPPSLVWPDLTLDAVAGVKLDRNAEVESPPSQPKAPVPPATIVNMATGLVELEEHASVDEIWSRSPVRVEARARVTGVVHAAQLFLDPQGSVGGRDSAPVLDPPTVTHAIVDFPAAPAAPGVFVRGGRSRDLTPGRYASIEVRPGGSLSLHSGSYFVERLTLSDGASVTLAASSGPVLIFARQKLEWRGRVAGRASQSNLALVYVGTTSVVVEAPFRGAVLASNAKLELVTEDGPHHGPSGHDYSGAHGEHDRGGGQRGHGQGHGQGHDHGMHDAKKLFQGAFFAKELVVGKNADVLYEPPNTLVPVVTPPDKDIQKCADSVRPRPDLVGAARERAYQIDIARLCSMKGADDCLATLVGRTNTDFTTVAMQLIGEQITPAEYLRLVRDRERKMDALEDDSSLRAALCGGHDADGDRVPDDEDDCPGTPELTATDDRGCPDPNLPDAPTPDDMRRIFDRAGFMFSAKCNGALMVPTQPVALIMNVDRNLYLSTTRLTNQPPECPVWYVFEIDSGPRQFQVAFRENEALNALLGGASPVPPGVIQFRITDSDTDTRADVLNDARDPAAIGRRPFRVRALNGAGMRTNWSPWVHSDCRPLGLRCGTGR